MHVNKRIAAKRERDNVGKHPSIFWRFVFAFVGGAALYVVLSKDYDAATQKWAFGVLGAVFAAAVKFLK